MNLYIYLIRSLHCDAISDADISFRYSLTLMCEKAAVFTHFSQLLNYQFSFLFFNIQSMCLYTHRLSVLWFFPHKNCFNRGRDTYLDNGASHFSSSTHHWVSTQCGRGLVCNIQGHRWTQYEFCTRSASRWQSSIDHVLEKMSRC